MLDVFLKMEIERCAIPNTTVNDSRIEKELNIEQSLYRHLINYRSATRICIDVNLLANLRGRHHGVCVARTKDLKNGMHLTKWHTA